MTVPVHPPPRTTVIVLAKAPLPGLAKTRLIPALGAAGAAARAERLLDDAVDRALAARLGPVLLCGTPDVQHPAFIRHAARPGVALALQVGADLGERMHHALAGVLGLASPKTVPNTLPAALPAPHQALLIGTDSPALSACLLRQAAAALATTDVVLVPALDGGYALIGLHQPAPSLFTGMLWSTPQVLASTRQRLAAAGLRHVELPAVQDIDEPADLAHLPAGWWVPYTPARNTAP